MAVSWRHEHTSIVRSISLLESVVDTRDATHMMIVQALRYALDSAADPCVGETRKDSAIHGVMRLYGLLKTLFAERPDLAVERRFSGPWSAQVERAIRDHCPEFQHIDQVSRVTECRA